MSQRKRRDAYRSDGQEPYRPRNKIKRDVECKPKRKKYKKPFRLQCKYIGDKDYSDNTFLNSMYNKEWHNTTRRYKTLKTALEVIDILNKKPDWFGKTDFKYRIEAVGET